MEPLVDPVDEWHHIYGFELGPVITQNLISLGKQLWVCYGFMTECLTMGHLVTMLPVLPSMTKCYLTHQIIKLVLDSKSPSQMEVVDM